MDQMLLNKVDEWLAAHRQEIIDDLIGLVRIPSVSVPDEVVPPFGQACRDALAYMYELGKKHGYTSQDYDHYVGSVTFTPGEEKVGIWAHLDVVPVPDPAEWDYPPFEDAGRKPLPDRPRCAGQQNGGYRCVPCDELSARSGREAPPQLQPVHGH